MYFEKIVRFLTGELEGKEQDELLNLVKTNSENKKNFEKVKKIWEKSSDLSVLERINVPEDWSSVQSRLKPKFRIHAKKIPLQRFILRAAVVIIIAFGLVWSLYKVTSLFPWNKMTAYSSDVTIREVILPDGSIVLLNKNSEIIFNQNFNQNNRELFFRGEGYFKVAENRSLPFVIRAQNSTIQAIGTSFNVKEDTSSVRITVTSGKVSIYETKNRNNHIEIIKNQAASFEYATRKIIYGQNSDLNFLSWKTGRFEFFKTPTVDVLTTIADYFDKKIVFKTSVSDSITGIFENQPLDEILKEIELTTSIKIENIQNLIIVRK